MAWIPIAAYAPQWVDSNGDPYSGAVLKSYLTGTTTNTNFATDSTGATQVTDIVLNANGYPAVSGSIVIPHTDQTTVKIALYPTQTAADADTGAIWSMDGVGGVLALLGTTTGTTLGFHLVKFPITAAETTAGVTPTNYEYPEDDILRLAPNADGVTDDVSVFDNIIAIAVAGGPKKFKLYPQHNYYLGSQVAINSTSASDIEIDGRGCTVTIGGNWKGFVATVSNVTGVIFRNINFVGNSSGSSNRAIEAPSGCNSWLIENCTFDKFGAQCINTTASVTGWKVKNNRFTDLYSYAMLLLKPINCEITGNQSGSTSRDHAGNIVLYGPQRCTVAGNVITTAAKTGILCGNAASSGNIGSIFNAITGNVINGCTEESIAFDQFQETDAHKTSGTATGSTATTLVDTGSGWTTNAYQFAWVAIVAGTGAGQIRQIASNTSDTLTVSQAWGVNPDTTSIYEVAAASFGNSITGNTMTGDAGANSSGLSLYGMCFNNTVSGNSVFATFYGISGVGVDNFAGGRLPVSYNVITGNTFHDVNRAIRMDMTSRINNDWHNQGNIITSNIIQGCPRAFSCNYQDYIQVHNNTIEGNQEVGFINNSVGIRWGFQNSRNNGTEWAGTSNTSEVFTDQDATPSVASGAMFYKTGNTIATTITDFDNGVQSQKITVIIADVNTTIDFTASGLKGNVGADWSPTTGDHMVCEYDGTDWFCIVSDNTA